MSYASGENYVIELDEGVAIARLFRNAALDVTGVDVATDAFLRAGIVLATYADVHGLVLDLTQAPSALGAHAEQGLGDLLAAWESAGKHVGVAVGSAAVQRLQMSRLVSTHAPRGGVVVARPEEARVQAARPRDAARAGARHPRSSDSTPGFTAARSATDALAAFASSGRSGTDATARAGRAAEAAAAFGGARAKTDGSAWGTRGTTDPGAFGAARGTTDPGGRAPADPGAFGGTRGMTDHGEAAARTEGGFSAGRSRTEPGAAFSSARSTTDTEVRRLRELAADPGARPRPQPEAPSPPRGERTQPELPAPPPSWPKVKPPGKLGE